MVDEIDIWRTAKQVIDQHGEDASTFAAMRADELLDNGDLEGSAVWTRIVKATIDLLATNPDGPVH